MRSQTPLVVVLLLTPLALCCLLLGVLVVVTTLADEYLAGAHKLGCDAEMLRRWGRPSRRGVIG